MRIRLDLVREYVMLKFLQIVAKSIIKIFLWGSVCVCAQEHCEYYCEDCAEFSPHLAAPDETKKEPILEKIVLVTSQEALEEFERSPLEDQSCQEVVNYDVVLPGSSKQFLEELEKKYLGGPLTEEQLIKVKRAIIRFYRRQKHPAVSIRISQESTRAGTVGFIIKEGKIELLPEDEKGWVSPDHLEAYVDLENGEYIAQDVLMNNVDWYNRNPFRRSVVGFLSDTDSKSVSDLVFSHPDVPIRVFAGADNSGTRYTGRARLYGGLTWGRVFGVSDLIHYQYTANTTVNKFQSHYGAYIYFLPWQDILTIFGLYETTHFGMNGRRNKGKNAQASFRYTSPFAPLWGDFKHELVLGIDYKNINTNLFFIESFPPIFSRTINILQLVVAYNLEKTWKNNDIRFSAELVSSPGKLMPNDTNAAYGTLRNHAKNHYLYLRTTLGDTYKLPRGFTIAGLLRTQVGTRALLPTEQFSLGGYNTVRGYHEHAFNGDQAICANVEVRSPSLSIVRKWKDEIFILTFADYGVGFNHRADSTIPSAGHLLGIGPGARYQIGTHFSIRADYGFRLLRGPGERYHLGTAHLGITGNY